MDEIRGACTPEGLRQRTKEFAVRVVKLYRSLLKSEEGRVLGRQVLRSGTSVAANYRSACRARSKAEFFAKLAVAVEEADETVFWLELLIETNTVTAKRLEGLLVEANELLAILAASRRTARRSITKSPDQQITKSPESLNPSIPQ